VPGSHDSSAGECFLVNPVTPTLGTQAVDANGNAITAPVNLGSEIYDTAALGGTSYEPGSGALGSDGSVGDPSHTVTRNTKAGGTITFTLTGPDTVGSTTNCNTAATGFTPILVDIANGGDGTYGGPTGSPVVGFTPAAPGVYHWKAAYSGDLPNTNSQTHNGDCSDSHENVTVKVPTTTTTRQFVYPQDKAKIAASAGGNLAGSVTFRLFNNSTNCGADNGTATATGLLYSEAGSLHPISGASPQFAETNNTSVAVTSNTTVFWHVVYTSTNTAQSGSASSCTESTQVAYVGNDSTITVP